MLEQYPNEISAGIIVINPKPYPKVLLLKANPGSKWSFPKGHVEENEDLKETALRELEEETGIRKEEVEILPNFHETIEYDYLVRNFKIHKKVHLFLGLTNKRDINLSYEHVDGKWFSLNEALTKVYPNLKNILIKAFSRVDSYLKENKLLI